MRVCLGVILGVGWTVEDLAERRVEGSDGRGGSLGIESILVDILSGLITLLLLST